MCSVGDVGPARSDDGVVDINTTAGSARTGAGPRDLLRDFSGDQAPRIDAWPERWLG